MSELPSGWVSAKLEEATSYVQRGKSPKYDVKSDLPVVNQKCIRWSGVDTTHLKYVHESQWPSWGEERFLQAGDILWNSTGTGTIGRAAKFEGLPSYERVVADSHVTILRANKAITPSFLHSYIRSNSVQHKIVDMQSGSTNQVELSKAEILNLTIPLPPVREQHRIVEKVDRLQSRFTRAQDELDPIPRLIERYKQAVLTKAFRGDLTGDWRSIRKDRCGSFVEVKASCSTDTRHLPSSWSVRRLGDLFRVCIGATPGRRNDDYWNGTISWVSSGEVSFCRIKDTREKITEKGLQNSSTQIHPVGTVLLAMIGQGKTRGQAAILDVPACNNQNSAAIIVPETDYPPEYVYYYLMMMYRETRMAGVGSGQSALNKARVKSIEMPTPPPEEAQAVVSAIEKAFSWIENITSDLALSSKLVAKLDQAILTKAFRGELVPQDPNDEPAAVLLERIRAERANQPKPRRGRKKKKETPS